MAYVPTDPAGPPPAHLVAMDIGQLINALKNNADALLVNGRMVVRQDLITANHEIKHIIGMIVDRAVQVEERENRLKEELDTTKGLLKYLQEVNTAREREITGIRRRLEACQNERNGYRNERNILQNERNNLATANFNQANQLQDQQVRHRRIRDNLQQRNNRLTHQLAVEQLTSRNLGRIRDRMQAQMAVLRIQAQWFRIRHAGPAINNPPANPQVVWLPLQ
jgi:chromosome segregation ATPase